MFDFVKKYFTDKKYIKKLVFVGLLLLVLIPSVSLIHAQETGGSDSGISPIKAAKDVLGFVGGLFLNVQAWFIGKVWYYIAWAIALLGSFIVGILIWVLQVVITASDGLVNSPAVQTGFPIVLSIANLFFVFAIIFVALATIIRNQTYNVKKLLANMILMAVLINFGLVISGAILGFSNRITNYFLDSMTGGSMNFADTVAGIVNPQKAITEINNVGENDLEDKTPGAAGSTAMIGGTKFEMGGSTLGSFITPITGALLSVVIVVILIVAFFSLIASFIMRYLKLTFLLILLPVAWIGSVLPGKTAGWTSAWWKKFNELAFYPPIVLFFLWLALRIGENATYQRAFQLPPESAGFLGGLVGRILPQLLNQIVMVGIFIGGDYAAKFVGAEASGAATKVAMQMKGWAQGKVKTGMKRAGVRSIDAARNVGSSRVGKAVANSAIGRFGAKISTLPIAGDLARMGGNTINRYATRAQEKMGASVSKSYKDDVSKMGEDELKVRAKAATGLELAAILDRASKDPKLMASVLKNIPDANKKFMAGEEDLYKRYGYGKAHEAAMLESGMTVASKHKTLEDARAENKKVADDPSSTDEQRKKANEEFIAAEKGFAEAIKKISADGANNLLFAKDKDGIFTLPDAQRKDIMQSLTGNKGWTPGRFNEFLQKAADAGNDSDISKLFEGMAAEKTNPAIIKALENGAMKNLGIDGDLVLGKELFAKAKEVHGVGEKKEKKGGPTTAVFE